MLAAPPALTTEPAPSSKPAPAPAADPEEHSGGDVAEPEAPADAIDLIEHGEGTGNGSRARPRKRTTVTLHSR